MHTSSFYLTAIVTLVALILSPTLVQGQSTAVGSSGMVASVEARATEIGVEILRKGGNAIDAAIAVHMALAVTHPNAGNIGGGGFFVIWLSEDTLATTIDFRETAPATASRDMYLLEDGSVDGNASRQGHRAVGVPGSVAGLWMAHQKYGSLPWSELLQPAKKLAEEGIILDYWQAASLAASSGRLAQNPAARAIFTKDGVPFKMGDLLVQRDLANTIDLIARQGRDGFYTGEVADAVAADMAKHGGLITREDLKTYEARERPAIEGTYRGLRIVSMPPPSSGGILLVQMLGMLETHNLKSLGHNSSRYIHLLTEIEKLAYADRAKHLGDSDFYEVPVSTLLSPDYIRERSGLVNTYRATPSSRISHGVAPAAESEETTHFSIVDRSGNAVSCTTTLNGSYGSGVVAAGTGVLLNNEMDDFSLKPGFPNMYGLIGGEANAIQPGKRMLSSMTPTILLKNDSVFLVTGSPGGSTIITTVLQTILNVVDHSMPLQSAVAAPRFHHQWLPDRIYMEGIGFSEDTLIELGKMGHTLYQRNWLGDVHAIYVDEEGRRFGVSDPRRGGVARGY